MRLAAAYLAEDYDGLIETARRMIQVIRSDIDFRLDSSSSTIRRATLQRHARRVQSIREGVATVRQGQKVPAYKVGNLDAEMKGLLKKIERAVDTSGSASGPRQSLRTNHRTNELLPANL